MMLNGAFLPSLRDGPLENFFEGGGGEGGRAKYKKKYSCKGKLNEKNFCTPINPKKYSCYGLKKIHTRNLITKKKSCGSKIPLPPHNFSNGPSLIKSFLLHPQGDAKLIYPTHPVFLLMNNHLLKRISNDERRPLIHSYV